MEGFELVDVEVSELIVGEKKNGKGQWHAYKVWLTTESGVVVDQMFFVDAQTVEKKSLMK